MTAEKSTVRPKNLKREPRRLFIKRALAVLLRNVGKDLGIEILLYFESDAAERRVV
jgi:hypothetical protein